VREQDDDDDDEDVEAKSPTKVIPVAMHGY
jgi:hypothetical protein